jgi:hypothetical protein
VKTAWFQQVITTRDYRAEEPAVTSLILSQLLDDCAADARVNQRDEIDDREAQRQD